MRLTSSQATTIAKLARTGPVELARGNGRDIAVKTAKGKSVFVGARGAIRS